MVKRLKLNCSQKKSWAWQEASSTCKRRYLIGDIDGSIDQQPDGIDWPHPCFLRLVSMGMNIRYGYGAILVC